MTAARLAVWLGSAEPVRSIRWLDGVLKAASKLGGGTAVAAGERAWLDLAADRAARFGLAAVGVPTDLQLDYLGWAQVMAAVAHKLAATTVLVDEASRGDRFAEVSAIAELLDAAQLTHVVALTSAAGVLHASRAAAGALQTVHVHGPAVIGVSIAGPAIDDYPTPMPSTAMRHLSLTALGLDPSVLSHRALPPRTNPPARKTVARIAEHLAVHVAARTPAPPPPPPPRDSRPKLERPKRAKTETKSHKPAGKGAKGARGDKSD